MSATSETSKTETPLTSETDLADVETIYSHLLQGKKIEVSFPSHKEAASFRIALARHKSRKDSQLIAVGIMTEDERQMLKFGRQTSETNGCSFIVSFEDKKSKRQFMFKILDDEVREVSSEVENGNGERK